jgi:hypothetical protein
MSSVSFRSLTVDSSLGRPLPNGIRPTAADFKCLIQLNVSGNNVAISTSDYFFKIGQLYSDQIATPDRCESMNMCNLRSLCAQICNLQSGHVREKAIAVLKGLVQVAIIAACVLGCVAAAMFAPALYLPVIAAVASFVAIASYAVIGTVIAIHCPRQTEFALEGLQGYKANLMKVLLTILSPILPFLEVRQEIWVQEEGISRFKRIIESGFARMLSELIKNKKRSGDADFMQKYDELRECAKTYLPPLPDEGYSVQLQSMIPEVS